MPDNSKPNAKLEKAIDQHKLIAFLEEKWGPARKCPMCGAAHWQIADRLYMVGEYVKHVLSPYSVVPVVPVTCTNCGNTLFVNASIADVCDFAASKTDGKEGGSDE